MAYFKHSALGLAIEERAILAAEVHVANGKAELRRAAEFALPEGASLDAPEALGAALREFLQKGHFAAKTVVIGLPARWLVTKEKAFPPAAAGVLTGMVRLEAERSFATEITRLAVDYVAPDAGGEGARVAMVAAPRARVEAAAALGRAAGLKVAAVTTSAGVLADALRTDAPTLLALCLRPGHVELAVRSDGALRSLRHLPVTLEGPAWQEALRAELLRATAQLPAGAPRDLAAWDGAGLGADVVNALGARAADPLADLGVTMPPDGARDAAVHCATAAALACAGARKAALPVDFLHSRLEVRGPSSRRRLMWAGAAAGALLIASGALFLEWRSEQRELTELRQKRDDLKPNADAARLLVDRVAVLRGWTDQRPRFLDPLRELTLAFPAEGRIWATSLAIRQDMRIAVSGKAADERSVLEVLDRLQANRAFEGVKLVYMRGAGGNSREVAFSMTLNFLNQE